MLSAGRLEGGPSALGTDQPVCRNRETIQEQHIFDGDKFLRRFLGPYKIIENRNILEILEIHTRPPAAQYSAGTAPREANIDGVEAREESERSSEGRVVVPGHRPTAQHN